MARERKFDGVWNAERVLSNYLKFANEDGFLIDMNSYEESPYKINQRRFLAAMKAYGREEKAFYHPDGLCQADSICRYIMSETRSKDKMDEFRNLIRQNLPSNAHYDKMVSSKDSFSSEGDIGLAFEELFEFRKGLFTLERKWSGVLECSPSLGMLFRATDSLYRNNVRVVGDVIDKMLVLLMGDDYDIAFTEDELFQYGYPDVTDDELYEMEMDW